MKKYLFSGLIVFSSLFLTACTTQKTTSNTSPESQKEESASFSLRDLIAQNIPQKCIYSGSNEEGSFNSEIIISGKKFNQVITFKSAEGEEKINSISDGEYVYTWGTHSTGGTFATKLKADFDTQSAPEVDTTSQPGQEVAESQVDLDTDYQGKCSPTVVTDANFQPPKDVKFQDYSQMMEDFQKLIPSGVNIPEQ
ncbi:MAG: hypothetical protein KIH89_001400 [Candidatus Shapirobacteria bacterium]|nr:hypothetical protein [Candidatus Shapirobacteria bacterium]